MDALRENHAELRKFVSAKFFPTGRAAPVPVSAATGAAGSPEATRAAAAGSGARRSLSGSATRRSASPTAPAQRVFDRHGGVRYQPPPPVRPTPSPGRPATGAPSSRGPSPRGASASTGRGPSERFGRTL